GLSQQTTWPSRSTPAAARIKGEISSPLSFLFFLQPLKLAPHVLPPCLATLELPRVDGPLPAEELVRCHRRRSALAESRHVVDDRCRDPRRALVGGLFLAAARLSRQ